MSVDELVNGRKKWALAFLIFLATVESNELHHGGLLLRRKRSDQFGKGFRRHSSYLKLSIRRWCLKAKGPAAEARHPGASDLGEPGSALASMENCEADYRVSFVADDRVVDSSDVHAFL